jgi:hypothetical protein
MLVALPRQPPDWGSTGTVSVRTIVVDLSPGSGSPPPSEEL